MGRADALDLSLDGTATPWERTGPRGERRPQRGARWDSAPSPRRRKGTVSRGTAPIRRDRTYAIRNRDSASRSRCTVRRAGQPVIRFVMIVRETIPS